jgi:SAM-dependent methyltransferase
MDQQEAYEKIAQRLEITPDLVPYLVEIGLDQTIINPLLPSTVKKFGNLLDLKPGKRILDLGCGKAGVTLPLVHTYKVHLTGVDMMPDYIREAWSRAEHTGLYELCNFRNADAAEFVDQVIGKKKWDAVFVMGLLPSIWPDQKEGVQKVKALTEAGGYVIIGEAYVKDGVTVDPGFPLMTREVTTDLVSAAGRIVEIMDDGDEGWEAYKAPQKLGIARLRENDPNNEALMAFLDQWETRMEEESRDFGFAAWVIQVD